MGNPTTTKQQQIATTKEFSAATKRPLNFNKKGLCAGFFYKQIFAGLPGILLGTIF